MRGHLRKLDLCHVHESVDFEFGSLEVLDAEGVDRDNLDSRLVADFEDLYKVSNCIWQKSVSPTYSSQSFKTQMMPLYCLHATFSSISPVAIHDESDMLWHRSLSQSSDEQFPYPMQTPFSWRGVDQPFANSEQL